MRRSPTPASALVAAIHRGSVNAHMRDDMETRPSKHDPARLQAAQEKRERKNARRLRHA